MKKFIGIDIGGSFIKAGIVSQQGQILDRWQCVTPAGVTDVIDAVAVGIQHLQSVGGEVGGVGVGVPGVVDSDGVVYDPPNLAGWDAVELQTILRSQITPRLWVENDANVAALAELQWGAGQSLRSFVYLTWGTGIGGGIILDRQLWKGAGWAGEVGHIILNASMPYQSNAGFRTGTFEQWIGRYGIEMIATQVYEQFHGTVQKIEGEQFVAAVREQEPWAMTAMAQVASIMAMGIVSIVSVIGVADVIIGGGFSNFPSVVFDHIQNVIRQRSLPVIARSCTVHRARWREQTGIIGAAALAVLKTQQTKGRS